MASARFSIREHTIPASYVREYARSTADDQETELKLAVKQYTPLRSAQPDWQGVTVIGAHANGFPKELYEPLWDELFVRLAAQRVYISNIWVADVAHQGQSGVLNEEQLGDEPSWMDHSRDMLLMVNHFRKQMQRPLIGIGHSMGGCQIVNLSLMHPRLFITVILMDPVIMQFNASDDNTPFAVASTRRRDRWPSREAAEAGFMKSKFYQSWDPRVMKNWLQYGLRDLPTYLHPNANDSHTAPSAPLAKTRVDEIQKRNVEVTLTTTKHQEVLSFVRPNFPSEQFPNPSIDANPRTHADVDPDTPPSSPFYRPEPLSTFRRLPFLRPSVLYLFADQSGLSMPLQIADKMASTGVGAGGSGGVKKGRVKQVTFKGVGHLIPMEATNDCAQACAEWIIPEVYRWVELENLDRAEQEDVPRHLRGQMSESYVKTMLSDWYRRPKESAAAKQSKL